MASIIDCFTDAIHEDLAIVKLAVFAVPVYFSIKLFMSGNMSIFYFWTSIFGVLFLGEMTKGINNIRMNKRSVLSLNPLDVIWALLKSLLVLIPQGLVLALAGHVIVLLLTSIPVNIEQYNLVVTIIVWCIIGSILLTSYLSFAKYLKVSEGYNLVVVSESCIDVFISVLFFVPQVIIVNAVVFWMPYYFFHKYMQMPNDHWFMLAMASVVIVINFSMFVNYLAQASYEQIKGNNEDYDDNYNKTNAIDDAAERMNGH